MPLLKEQKGMNRFTDLNENKLRGGYYTSVEVANWLCKWAIRTPHEGVLEPSCGDGVFLVAAAKRFIELGSQIKHIPNNLTGIEIIEDETNIANAKLQKIFGNTFNEIIKTIDFFEWWQINKLKNFDVVIGNPPFIRYQAFPEPHRSRAISIMAELGLTANRLTNIWVPFVVAATAMLRPGGRLALVLPAELLQVTYAGQLRSFISDNFTRIDIVTCNELFFENAEQEVVLLLADGKLGLDAGSNNCRITLTEAHTVAEITGRIPDAVLADAQPKTIIHDQEKWLKYFLSERDIAFMRALRSSDKVTHLATHASIDVGVVTGKNEFFVLTNDQVLQFGLTGYTVPLVSRSAHIRGSKINKADLINLSNNGDRIHLLHMKPHRNENLPDSVTKYIHSGEDNGFHKGYKCSIREPWYEVPSVWIPDGFAFRQIYNFPFMILNQAEVTSTDTIHRLSCKSANPERVLANTYTYLTAASAEIEGRSYGGGVLELEPTEAEHLLMPSILVDAMPFVESDRLIRSGRLNDVLEENSQNILMSSMGLSRGECNQLQGIWEKMRDRRMSRSRRKNNVSKEILR